MIAPPSVHAHPGASRIAVRMRPAAVRTFIPPDVIGVYLLMIGQAPIYVGRSDTCLQRRLVTHPLAEVATHVAFEPCGSVERAFLLEAFWYHELFGGRFNLNLNHPARPEGSTMDCPFCRLAQQRDWRSVIRPSIDTKTN